MGEVKLEDIFEILDNYDKDNITIATLGSHTSLHILQGAKEEGLEQLLFVKKEEKYHINVLMLQMNI